MCHFGRTIHLTTLERLDLIHVSRAVEATRPRTSVRRREPLTMLETTHTLRVRFGETDAFGIVFYANFYAYFDVAVIELMRAGPYGFSEMRARGFGVPVVESGARFIAPLLADDEIVVTTRVTEVRTRSFRVEHDVFRERLKVATGFSIRAFSSYSAELARIVLADMPEVLHTYLNGASDG